jgi:hypothetical protein
VVGVRRGDELQDLNFSLPCGCRDAWGIVPGCVLVRIPCVVVVVGDALMLVLYLYG